MCKIKIFRKIIINVNNVKTDVEHINELVNELENEVNEWLKHTSITSFSSTFDIIDIDENVKMVLYTILYNSQSIKKSSEIIRR